MSFIVFVALPAHHEKIAQTNREKLEPLLSTCRPRLRTCEGCLVVITGHGPQAEVARVFGHELLVDRGEGRLESLEEEQRKGEEKGDG